MDKKTIVLTDLQRKSYEKPQIRVVEMKGADIICTSGRTEAYSEGDTDDWFNN